MKKAKRFTALLLALLMACSLLAGCGSSGSESGDAETKDVFVAAMRTDFVTFDPAKATGTQNQANLRIMYDPLVDLDENGNVIPCVATSWELSEDGNAYIFQLRDDIKFHNGEPLTAADVVYELEREMESGLPTGNNIESVEQLGDYEVKVNMITPTSLQPKILASTMIPCKSAVIAAGDDYSSAPVGSGKYIFVSYSPSESAKFTRNDEYWGEKAIIKDVEMRYIPDDTTRAMSLESGDVDFVTPLSASDFAMVDSNPDTVAVAGHGGMQYYLSINCTANEWLSNKLVRQAISYAVDRTAINTAAFESTASEAYLIVDTDEFGYDESYAFPDIDLEKAKALMEEAGCPGFSCSLVTTAGASQKACEILQASLKQLNIEVDIQTQEFSAYLDSLCNKNFDLCMGGWTNSLRDASNVCNNLLLSTSENNSQNWGTDEVDQMIIAADRSQDPQERKDLYGQIFSIILDECPVVPVVFGNVVYGYRSNVQNLNENVFYWVDYSKISFAS